jgi:hypothetical protein
MTIVASDSRGRGGGKDRLGRYRLLELIATGGMAEIHLARAEGAAGFEKLLAIKRILPEHARDAEFVAMFLLEARIAATLHHANVVQVYDFGYDDGSYFLAMEYLRGSDTRRIVDALARAGQRMPLEIAVAIAMGAAAGLHYLHDKRDAEGRPLGLVHRDVSPQNIFVTADGTVKMVDFGIAKAVNRGDGTRAGTVKGKIGYLSPEQCRAEPLDRRSDVFSLAVVLWELTVGRRLFEGDSDFNVMRAIDERDAPNPSSLVPDYPRALERIVQRGLARDRDRRYASAEEMLVDLESFARDRKLAISPRSVAAFVAPLLAAEVDAPVAPGEDGARARTRALPREAARPRRRRSLVAAMVLATAGGALAAGWLVTRGRASTARPAAAAPAPPPAVAAPVMVAPPPPAPPPPAPAPEVKAAADEAPPPRERTHRTRARRSKAPAAPSPGAPAEKWSPDSPVPPP